MYKQNLNRNNNKFNSEKYGIAEEEVSINLEPSINNLGDLIQTNNEHFNLITCHSKKYKMLTAKSSSFDLVLPSSKFSFSDLLNESNESEKSTKSNLDYNQEFIVDDSLVEEDDDQYVSQFKRDHQPNKPIDQIITIDEKEVTIVKDNKVKKAKGRIHDYEAIDHDVELERQIDDAW
jgi:hypothetical protein